VARVADLCAGVAAQLTYWVSLQIAVSAQAFGHFQGVHSIKAQSSVQIGDERQPFRAVAGSGDRARLGDVLMMALRRRLCRRSGSAVIARGVSALA
jgi:hypothetical protein